MPPIGFVILTHQLPNQTLRLVRTLGAMFDGPPIVIHHDFGKCPLDPADFPKYVRFVRPHVSTDWGSGSVNDAVVLGLAELFRASDAPERFILLSGSDYPIKPAERIIQDLAADPFDLYLQHRLIDRRATDSFSREMAKRYLRAVRRMPVIHWNHGKPRLGVKRFWVPGALSRPLLPWTKTFRCYAGVIWCAGNRHAAELIVAMNADNPLKRIYNDAPCSDEFYLHSLVCNRPDIRVSPDNKRYIQFEPGVPNPRMLGLDDLPAMIASSAHFARKFEPGDPVLDRLDEMVAPCRK